MKNPQNSFTITFDSNYFTPTDVVLAEGDQELKILCKPKRPILKLLLQYITFGWYQCPWYYKVQVQ